MTRKLDDFVHFAAEEESPTFSITIHEYQDESKVLWRSDPSKLFLSKYLVFDNGIFNMSQANGNPLMGMGERAGNLFYKDENLGIHSRWTHDGANPIDDGLPPGRNMYGFQPLYVF